MAPELQKHDSRWVTQATDASAYQVKWCNEFACHGNQHFDHT